MPCGVLVLPLQGTAGNAIDETARKDSMWGASVSSNSSHRQGTENKVFPGNFLVVCPTSVRISTAFAVGVHPWTRGGREGIQVAVP